MKLQEISKPRTAEKLNETLAKTFGQKIDLDSFTLEQLQDARNRVRTSLSAIETNESFDATMTNEEYQKNKMYLEVLNAAIAERDDVEEARNFGLTGALDSAQDAIDSGWDQAKKFGKRMFKKAERGAAKTAKRARNAKKRFDISRQVPRKKSAVRTTSSGQQAGKVAGQAKRAIQKSSIMYTNGSALKEGAQEQAELVMAAKELVDTVGKWLQDTAEMQSESMLKLSDAIRDELGQEQADQFQQSVKPTLEALYQALEASRGALTQGVSLLTGEGAAPEEMGAEPAPEGEMEPTMDAEVGMGDEAGMEAPPEDMAAAGGDEFATAPAAGGGMEDAGRPQRESISHLSHSLGQILSSKKK